MRHVTEQKHPLRWGLVAVAALGLLIPAVALGQGGIQGSVTDTLTREGLVGANVFLQGTALGGVTDREGRFVVNGIPAGNYNLRISYIGYRRKDIPISVPASGSLTINAALQQDVVEGEEVVITAQIKGQVAAINQQITSNTIINVISEEKIKELPDANAAEAIGRLPGVSILRSGGEANKVILRGMSDKFTSFTLDGVRIPPTDADTRGVDLSMFSQGTLAGVELFKALTPDKDADAIAGSINMVTRKAPAERTFRVDLKNAYSRLNDNFGQYDFNGKYGERFFDGLLGVQLTGNIERRDRSNESYNMGIENLRDILLTSGWQYTNMAVNFTDEIRRRSGAGLLLDLNTPDGGTIRVNNIYSRTDRAFTNFARDYPIGDDPVYLIRDREQAIKTFSSTIRGENLLAGLEVAWGISFAESNGENPYDYRMFFKEPSSPTSGMMAEAGLHQREPPGAFIPYAYNNFRAATIDTANFDTEKNLDKEKTASLDLARKYAFGTSVTGELKLGGKYRYRNRFKESTEMYSPYYLGYYQNSTLNADGSITPKDYTGTRFANLQRTGQLIWLTNFLDATPEERDIYDSYRLYPLINRDAMREWYELNQHGISAAGTQAEYHANPEVRADYYDIVERISAAYLMNTLNLGSSITFIAGVRVESESNDYTAKYVNTPLGGFPTTGSLYDTTSSFTETSWLPNFHLVVRPAEFMTVRLAAYRALARPDFSLRLARTVSRVTNPRNPVVVGDPRLPNARAWNFEINTSFHGNDLGLLSLSAYYREITDMFHTASAIPGQYTPGDSTSVMEMLGITYRPPFAAGSPVAVTAPYSSSRPTKVWGLELEHQATLGFLPGLLSHIVLSYNLSLVRSETHILTGKEDTIYVIIPPIPVPVPRSKFTLQENKQTLEGQPEFFGNVAIGYDLGGFSGRLSVFFQGEYYRSFSARRTADPLAKPFSRWDLTLKQRVTDFFSVYLNLNNLTSIEEESYTVNQRDSWDVLRSSQRYGLTGDLGVRFEF